VKVLLDATVTEIGERSVAYLQKGTAREIRDVDTVILAAGARPNDSLWKGLKDGPGRTVFAIGDCTKARNILEAVYEGSKIAREI